MIAKSMFAAIACVVVTACAAGPYDYGNNSYQFQGSGGYGDNQLVQYGGYGGYGGYEDDRGNYGDNDWVPPGSYRQSCSNIVVRRGMLEAICGGNNGGVRTSIPLSSCRSGNFENINGNLQCAGGGDYGRPYQDIPPGSYRQSCSDISVRRGILEATCGGNNGGVRTSISLSSCRSGNFENINGNLQCAGGGDYGRPDQDIPPGSYRQSCSDISVRRGILEATCGGSNNNRVRSSIPLSSCRSGNFENINGNLQCGR